ncbi:MAG TPA: FadR/GntR family transcriptional regulator [Jatrophihabitans sp.]|nr:FadR/GntR family transcriptional regulator [Jatrophihabitans sp.]
MADEPLFKPVRRVRAYEAMVEQVENAIRQGDLMPGDRLPSERELITQFQLSRSTIREALRVLESKGLVRSRPADKRGVEVLAFSTLPLSESINSLVQLERLTLPELIFFRMLVEGALAGLAAQLRTDENLEALRASIENMRQASAADRDTYTAADVAFHDTISDIAGNRMLIVCNQVVRASVQNLIAEKIASGKRRRAQMLEAVQRHVALYEAIKDGDAPRAIRVSRTNLFEYYTRHVAPADLERLKILLD